MGNKYNHVAFGYDIEKILDDHTVETVQVDKKRIRIRELIDLLSKDKGVAMHRVRYEVHTTLYKEKTFYIIPCLHITLNAA